MTTSTRARKQLRDLDHLEVIPAEKYVPSLHVAVQTELGGANRGEARSQEFYRARSRLIERMTRRLTA